NRCHPQGSLSSLPLRPRLAFDVRDERRLSRLRSALRARAGVLDRRDDRELLARRPAARGADRYGVAPHALGRRGGARDRRSRVHRRGAVRLALLPRDLAASGWDRRSGPWVKSRWLVTWERCGPRGSRARATSSEAACGASRAPTAIRTTRRSSSGRYATSTRSGARPSRTSGSCGTPRTRTSSTVRRASLGRPGGPVAG